jgi:hypothetical protein
MPNHEIGIPGLTGITDNSREHHAVLGPANEHHPHAGRVVIATFPDTPQGKKQAIARVSQHNQQYLGTGNQNLYTRIFLEDGDEHPSLALPKEEPDITNEHVSIKIRKHARSKAKNGDGLRHTTPKTAPFTPTFGSKHPHLTLVSSHDLYAPRETSAPSLTAPPPEIEIFSPPKLRLVSNE